MSKQYRDLDTGEFHWTDEYVEGLEQRIKELESIDLDWCKRDARSDDRIKELEATIHQVREYAVSIRKTSLCRGDLPEAVADRLEALIGDGDVSDNKA